MVKFFDTQDIHWLYHNAFTVGCNNICIEFLGIWDANGLNFFHKKANVVARQNMQHYSNTVTVTVNGLVKLLAFNAHICPSKYLVSF